MAPLILDEEEAVDEDEDHGDNDHQHNHQAAVQVLQSTQRAHLRKYIGDQDYFGCQMVRWNYNFVKVLKITKSSGLSTICLN